jgi:hypothetical protein
MATLDWSQCPAVESIPGKVSGAWVFKGTRLPVATVIENDGRITRRLRLVLAECNQRVDQGGAPGRQPGGQQCGHSENDSGRDEDG